MEVPETVKPVIGKLSELVKVKELHANVVTLGIEVDLSLSEKRFHQFVKQIETLGFKLERVTFGEDGYFDAIYRNYETGESIVVSYVPIDQFIIHSITYHKRGDMVK